MSSANVNITKSMTAKTAAQYANAAFHGDNRMENVLLRNLGAQLRVLSSQVNLGGVVTGRLPANAGASQVITLGFQPSAIEVAVLSGVLSLAKYYSGMAMSSVLLLNGNPASMNLLTTEGFVVTSTGFRGKANVFPLGKPCNYVAMRRIGP